MTPTTVANIEIPTDDTHPMRADLYRPSGDDVPGIALLFHGFKGYKTWGFLPYLAQRIGDVGLAALAIDFSHNGTFPEEGRPGRDDAASTPVDGAIYPRTDLFRANTLSREYHDVHCAVRFVQAGGLERYLDTPRSIGLFGHSRGGVVALLYAVEHPKLAAVCTWSVADDPDFYTPVQKRRWRELGAFEFIDARGGEPLSVGVDYLNDLEDNHEFYFVRERVRDLRVPHLAVHGRADIVVKVGSAIAIHDAEVSLKDKSLLILQTGHTFGIPYPQEPVTVAMPNVLVEAANETATWFKTHLIGGGMR